MEYDDVCFSLTGKSAPAGMGKCTASLRTHLPEPIDAEFRQLAHALGCTPSELMRDMVCLATRGLTFGELAAEERRQALGSALGSKSALFKRVFQTFK